MSELEAGRLRLFADLGADGAPRALYLEAAAGELRLRREPDEGRPPLRLPAGAVAAVCARYGRPLAEESRAALAFLA